MRIKTWFWTLAGFVAVAGAACVRPLAAEEGVIEVTVLNRAGVDHAEVMTAFEHGRQIFARSGVVTRWLDCTPDELGYIPEGPCQEPGGPARLTLRIVKRPHKGAGLTLATFGLATYPERGFARRAEVFSERARILAHTFGSDVSLILGVGMAHEVGHLLLGEGSHSRSGIMTAHWGDREVMLAQRGMMQFSSKQVRKIQSAIRARGKSAAQQPISLPNP